MKCLSDERNSEHRELYSNMGMRMQHTIFLMMRLKSFRPEVNKSWQSRRDLPFIVFCYLNTIFRSSWYHFSFKIIYWRLFFLFLAISPRLPTFINFRTKGFQSHHKDHIMSPFPFLNEPLYEVPLWRA
jgi:hypothetical protein